MVPQLRQLLTFFCFLVCYWIAASPSMAWQRSNASAKPNLRTNKHSTTSALTAENVAAARIIERHLNRSYVNRILSVQVGERRITVSGRTKKASADLFLRDIPLATKTGEVLNQNALDQSALIPVEIVDKRFTVELPRFVNDIQPAKDRLLSRWQLFEKTSSAFRPASNVRYAEDVACNNPDLPAAELKSKKGLGGWNPARAPQLKNELAQLGITSVTVNVFPLHAFVSPVKRPGHSEFQWQGQSYFANEAKFAKADKTFRAAAEQGAMVSAILLAANAPNKNDANQWLLNHPDTQPEARYAIPNMTSSASVDYYGAIINFMAQRWSRPDGKFGRVHHWIVHNEVDFAWEWANAGVKSDVEYMDLYHRSMRLVDLIVRQHDPHARAWISLTHHWAKPGHPRAYGSKRMLALLRKFCSAQGDFPWGVAFHPYPQSLLNPRSWEDKQAVFNFDTPKITPKNIEVLDAYMAQRKLQYRGETRPVQLSENGFNSPDYSPESFRDQAAGMAMAWKKIENLDAIIAWQYHNWIDNRNEGKLRLGLRRFKDDKEQPLGKKPIWGLYQALATDQEDAACEPYLKTIGINSWSEVQFSGKIK